MMNIGTEPTVDDEENPDEDQSDRDCDDWSNYPASKSSGSYHLTGYCGITGRARFKKLTPIMEEEENFNIIASEDKEDDGLFE